MIKVGDKVKYVGDINCFIKSVQPVFRRVGRVTMINHDWSSRLKNIMVTWMPKTKRGRPESYRHSESEIEVIE